jgi:hypothetical protein
MEEVRELIRRYGLEEDLEHVIIPVTERDGHTRRIFLLKRRFIRIAYPEGYNVDYPLAEAIEATVRYPGLLLSEALYLMHKELGTESRGVPVKEEAGIDEAGPEIDKHSALQRGSLNEETDTDKRAAF